MTLTDEKLSAYLDGELPSEEMDRITDEIATDHMLAARLETLRASDAWLSHQFAAADEKPIRADTLDLIKQFDSKQTGTQEEAGKNGNVVTLKPNSRWASVTEHLSWGHAVAASVALFIGVGAGWQLGDTGRSGSDFATLQTAGLILPTSPLYDVLETTPSLETVSLDRETASATALMSFESTDGGYCRELQVSTASSHSRSIACRTGLNWLVKATIASSGPAPASGSDFVPASSAENALIDQSILSLMKNDALSSEDESRLISRGWQPD